MEINRNSSMEEIEKTLDEKGKELRKAIYDRAVVREERDRLIREIMIKDIKKKDLGIELSKATDIVTLIKEDLKECRGWYWDKKQI